MKKIVFFGILLLLLTNCERKQPQAGNKTLQKEPIAQDLSQSKGYKLMQQKCFICHFPVPDPARKSEMIAPPMLRVQEHYKPADPDKKEFVAAIKAWVKQPSEDKIQMPGAARKFKIMPYLNYPEDEIQLIAETLYDVDFGTDFSKGNHGMKMEKNQKLQLNGEEKWVLDKESVSKVKGIITQLNNFDSNEVKAFQKLGTDVFNTAKTLILNKNLNPETLTQVQVFFHSVEGNIHKLMQVETVKDGKAQQQILQNKFNKFFNYFK